MTPAQIAESARDLLAFCKRVIADNGDPAAVSLAREGAPVLAEIAASFARYEQEPKA